ncbi:hypothetical protein HYDPIDRAFT_27910 [Hydnomerulius pinastri MD-312]|uniref:Dienelactone hydrolase domain-containing protein n=1 Tax=Hydnomerulius pinastri MD-312 TaxID=994086 RepID=A0A0C9WFW9_9AGAM|nr:hypothetical protein HYDPIDRAFT_27910 [Hydnomerulius pinastri MD-312]
MTIMMLRSDILYSLHVGVLETIGGVTCYVGTPTGDYDHQKVLLLFTDMFGITLGNNKLLVDDFAKCGFKTIAPDYLNGDEAPPYAMNNPEFNVKQWVQKHLPAQTRPPIDKVIAALKEQGVTTFAVTGYCFGGRYTFDLACENIIKVAIVAHPSQLKVPDDFTKYLNNSKAPLCIEVGDVDVEFPLKNQETVDGILGDGKFAPGYKRDCWPNMEHGFAVRGDILDPGHLAGKEGAFKNTVAWLKQYF